MDMRISVSACVFDAYGTLLDVAGAARLAASEPGGERLADLWPRVAETWRAKQLSYTWLRAAMGLHADFAQVTADALDWTLEKEGIADPALRDRLLSLYTVLPCFPEVPAMLAAIRARGMPTAILSNGTQAMLGTAIAAAGISELIGQVLSVESVGVYKPHPAVYRLGAEAMGLPPERILFVSSNGWDAAGAAAYGYRTFWANRRGEPVDNLPGRPEIVRPDLSGLADLIA
jgi:2-haloacid dehalogenase